jgi:hypothetical protein
MSAAAIAAIIVVVGIVVLVMLAMTVHRRRLQQRFGEEYHRLVTEHRSSLRAQAELGRREWRVQRLSIRPLTDAERAMFATDWTAAQARFVDSPRQAVDDGAGLVAAIMKERGYPAESPERIVGDLSIAHPGTVTDYRIARQIGMDAAAGVVSTEDLRQAMIHYRAVFGELLGQPGDGQPRDGQPGDAQASAARPGDAPVSDAGAIDGQASEPPAIGAGPGAAGPRVLEPRVVSGPLPADTMRPDPGQDEQPSARPTGRFRIRVPLARSSDEDRP